MVRLDLRVGGMESREDVVRIRAALDPLPGIDAFDVLRGKVRLTYDPRAVSTAAIFAAIAECGDGHDVELD